MNPINSFVQHFASAALHAAPAGVIALTLLGTALAATGTAAITCPSGTVINDSLNGYVPVGCLFTKWTGTEMGQCHDQGLTIFGPNNSGTFHICVLPQYASLLANGSASSADPHGPASFLNQTSAYFTTRLTIDKWGISYFDGMHTPFRNYQCTSPPAGLAAWWMLDDWATMPVKDAMAQMPDGVYHGTTKVIGQSGNAEQFAGTSGDYVEIPDGPAVNVGSINDPGKGDFSIAAWVKIDSQDANWLKTSNVRVIVEKRVSGTGYSFYLYNGYLGLQLGAGSPQNFGAQSLVVPADSRWHLVGARVKRIGADVQFFMDGTNVQLLPDTGVPSGSLANSNPLRIGMGNLNNGSDAFKGSIDEVQFFNRALAASEFQSILNAGPYGTCK